MFRQSTATKLANLLEAERHLLDEILGTDEYELLAKDGDVVRLLTDNLTISFSYDFRDGWVEASLSPERIDLADADDHYGSFQWAEYLGIQHPKRERRPLSKLLLREELEFLRPILSLFSDKARTEAAKRHIAEREREYNAFASGRATSFDEDKPPSS